jgi:NifU-like protein
MLVGFALVDLHQTCRVSDKRLLHSSLKAFPGMEFNDSSHGWHVLCVGRYALAERHHAQDQLLIFTGSRFALAPINCQSVTKESVMWDYTEKVKEHFFNPRNAGPLEDANAVGDVGSIQCGDALRLMLKVEPESDKILDARFQTFGCGSAIASSSALTEMVKGKTLDEALVISNQDIAAFLDGLPPEKMHCSVMGREALQAAIANYRGDAWHDDHAEGELICKCYAIDSVLIEQVVRENKLKTVAEVTNYTKAGGACASCHEKIEEVMTRVLQAMGEEPAFAHAERPARSTVPTTYAPPAATEEQPAGKPKMTNLQRIRKIEEVIETIRPMLQRDHGDIEIVDIIGKNIYVNMQGACMGCAMESATFGGIQQKLFEELGEFVRLLPASQMEMTR